NMAAHPEKAEQLGVRSVPWIRIGDFELEGLHTPAELKLWVQRASSEQGIADYLSELLTAGQLPRARSALKKHPHWLQHLLTLMSDPESNINVKVGIGALMEEFDGSEVLQAQVPRLIKLSQDSNHSIRGDACHYLGLSRSHEAIPAIRARLQDEHTEVREIAAETLEELAME
ncbi:MAG: HEAT repeat domain-containing protein, partial [Gammaproteobacteria bacterium]|nr:HEAT repeat domain-containing protein [Gammaproteobacteria bacterium]